MKIYLIPGLGYDSRIFEKLNFKGHEVTSIDWIDPKKNESIQEYSKRLFQDLPVDEDETILIGHSFGGIVSQEIATVKRIEKIILISSIQSRNEMSRFFKLVKPLKLYKLFTKEISIKTIKYWGADHGFLNEEEKDVFKSMVGKQSNHYLQWALKTLSGWREPVVPKETEIFHIHGTDDKTFPVKLLENPDAVVENGTHIMLYKQPQEINEIILSQLNKNGIII